MTPAERASARSAVGARSARQLSPLNGSAERLLLPAGTSVEEAIAALDRLPQVRYAEPDYVITPTETSNDPYYLNGSGLWGMHGDAISLGANAYGSQADEAWANGDTGSSNVYIGVVDTGVQITHPDLDANLWTNPFEIVDGLDDDGNGYVDDVHGWDFAHDDATVFDGGQDDHGTHVAGTIGAEGGNAIGVAGVSWNVTMIPAKFLGPDIAYTSDAISALDYLTDLKLRHGLNIVATNNSWRLLGFQQSMLDAIQRGDDANILFIAAAGNTSSDADLIEGYPSDHECTTRFDTGEPRGWDCVIGVAAIDQAGALATFSNYGTASVDLGAPGVSITSTVPSGYRASSGTSMATPHVTGAVALCASVDPSLTADRLRAAVLGSTSPTSSLAGVTATGGRLNVGALIARCRAPAGPVLGEPSGLAATATGTSRVQLVWTDGASAEQAYEVERSDGTACDPATFTTIATMAEGSESYAAAGLAPASEHCFRVRAVNDFEDGSASSYATSAPIRTHDTLGPYTCVPTIYAWVDATTGTKRTLADDASVTVSPGFGFRFFGTSYTSLKVSSNGFVRFGSGPASSFWNAPIPTLVDPNGYVAAFWDDLDPAAGGAVWTRTIGVSPNRRFVAAWVGVPLFHEPGTSVTVELVLEESTNAVVLQYQDVVTGIPERDLGGSATVGIETLEERGHADRPRHTLARRRHRVQVHAIAAGRGDHLEPPGREGRCRVHREPRGRGWQATVRVVMDRDDPAGPHPGSRHRHDRRHPNHSGTAQVHGHGDRSSEPAWHRLSLTDDLGRVHEEVAHASGDGPIMEQRDAGVVGPSIGDTLRVVHRHHVLVSNLERVEGHGLDVDDLYLRGGRPHGVERAREGSDVLLAGASGAEQRHDLGQRWHVVAVHDAHRVADRAHISWQRDRICLMWGVSSSTPFRPGSASSGTVAVSSSAGIRMRTDPVVEASLEFTWLRQMYSPEVLSEYRERLISPTPVHATRIRARKWTSDPSPSSP